MARRRPNTWLQPPKLLEFRAEDWWPAVGPAAWRRWHDARFEYLLEHPWQTLGGSDAVDVISERRVGVPPFRGMDVIDVIFEDEC